MTLSESGLSGDRWGPREGYYGPSLEKYSHNTHSSFFKYARGFGGLQLNFNREFAARVLGNSAYSGFSFAQITRQHAAAIPTAHCEILNKAR